MFVKFFRYRKNKKKVREIALRINNKNEKIIDDLIQNSYYGKDVKLIECLQFESRVFLFWLFLKSDCLNSEFLHKLVLDEVHEQYYNNLKKLGYDFDKRQNVANKLNERYRSYNKCFFQSEDPMSIGYEFQGFVNGSMGKVDGDDEILIPLLLVDRSNEFFDKLSNVSRLT